jgi:hypothetical protein
MSTEKERKYVLVGSLTYIVDAINRISRYTKNFGETPELNSVLEALFKCRDEIQFHLNQMETSIPDCKKF